MSAIVAAFAPGGLRPEDRRWVERATAFCRRFAPDGDGVWADERCAIGHALLRTAPAEAVGPVSADGGVRVAADVRLDERPAGARGGAEGVLAAYERWGARCVDHLQGDFAFALWDPAPARLLCARDQMGVAQLSWARAGGTLLVATALDALLLHPGVADGLDEDALADFVANRVFQDPAATAFAAIRRVPPGHVLTAEGVRRYWRLPSPGPLLRLRSAEAYAERYLAALDAAVAARVSDRVTAHVSGGLDSTSVAVSARRAVPAAGALQGITYTLGAGTGDLEAELATAVAAHAGFPLDVLDLSCFPPHDPLAEPLVRTPEPTAYLATGLEVEFARRAAAHGPVALSGDGGDALLAFDPAWWLRWLREGRVARTALAFAEQVRADHTRPRPRVREIRRQAARRRTLAPQSAAPA